MRPISPIPGSTRCSSRLAIGDAGVGEFAGEGRTRRPSIRLSGDDNGCNESCHLRLRGSAAARYKPRFNAGSVADSVPSGNPERTFTPRVPYMLTSIGGTLAGPRLAGEISIFAAHRRGASAIGVVGRECGYPTDSVAIRRVPIRHAVVDGASGSGRAFANACATQLGLTNLPMMIMEDRLVGKRAKRPAW